MTIRTIYTERTAPAGNQWQEALHAALVAALPGKALGVGSYAPSGKIIVYMDTTANGDDDNTALQLVAAHDTASRTPEQTAINAVRTAAQSAVGVVYTDLTTAQLRALLAVLIFESGGIDANGAVRPLGQWVKRGE